MPVDPSRVRARVRARARPRPRRPRHPRLRASACGRFERASTAARGEPARGCAVGIASAAADVASATVAFRTPPPFARAPARATTRATRARGGLGRITVAAAAANARTRRTTRETWLAVDRSIGARAFASGVHVDA